MIANVTLLCSLSTRNLEEGQQEQMMQHITEVSLYLYKSLAYSLSMISVN